MLLVDRVPHRSTRPAAREAVIRIIVALVLILVVGACGASQPSIVPGQFLHVLNNSNRAVMIATGSVLDAHATTAARPCGGEVSVDIVRSSYEDDGRLMSFMAVDSNGVFDVTLKNFASDPIDIPGNFTAAMVWSDGTLAGRLPVYLTVAADLTVTESVAPGLRSTAACVPAY